FSVRWGQIKVSNGAKSEYRNQLCRSFQVGNISPNVPALKASGTSTGRHCLINSVFQSAGDANQSVRDLSKQGTLDGKFERQERLERVHDGEYSGILTVKAKRVFAKRSAQGLINAEPVKLNRPNELYR